MIVIFTRFSVLVEQNGFQYFGDRAHSRLKIGQLAVRSLRWLPRRFRPGRQKKVAKLSSLSERQDFLFSDERLRFRFKCFEAITLPSLFGQTDLDFRYVVLYSVMLPEKWLDRLTGLSERYGFNLVAMKPSNTFTATYQDYCRNLYKHEGPHSAWIATARIDDDDALNIGYVSWIRNLADEGHRDVVVSSHDGVLLRIDNGRTGFAKQSIPFVSAGLAYIESFAESSKTIGSTGPHHLVYQRSRTLILNEANAYLMTAHVHNDSTRFSSSLTKAPDVADAEKLLQETFRLDPGVIRAAFAPAS